MDIQSLDEFKRILTGKFGKTRAASKGYIRIKCPTCTPHDAKKLKRYVHPSMVYSNCYICGESLTVTDLIGNTVNIERNSFPVEEEAEHPLARSLPFTEAIPINQLPSNHPAVEFLKKDFIYNLDFIWEKFGVVYIPANGSEHILFPDSGWSLNTADSLLFPVKFQGELVGWQCRFIPGTLFGDRMNKMKYFHLFNKGKYLYNYDTAKKSPYVVLMEGVKKTWKHPRAAVSSLGKNLAEKQIQLIQEWKTIILFLDGEDKTQIYARELQELLFANSRMCLNIDPREYGVKSPDEMTTEQVTKIIDETLNLTI